MLPYIQFKGVKVYFNSWPHSSAPHGAEGIVEGRDFHSGQYKQERSDAGTPQVFSPPPFLGPSGLQPKGRYPNSDEACLLSSRQLEVCLACPSSVTLSDSDPSQQRG